MSKIRGMQLSSLATHQHQCCKSSDRQHASSLLTDCLMPELHLISTNGQKRADALQESVAIRVLQAICNSNHTEFLHYAAEHSMNPDCHMGGEPFPPKLWPSTLPTPPPPHVYVRPSESMVTVILPSAADCCPCHYIACRLSVFNANCRRRLWHRWHHVSRAFSIMPGTTVLKSGTIVLACGSWCAVQHCVGMSTEAVFWD